MYGMRATCKGTAVPIMQSRLPADIADQPALRRSMGVCTERNCGEE